MKKKEKQFLAILIIAVVVIIGVIWLITNNKKTENKENGQKIENNGTTMQGEFTKEENDGTIVNTSEKLKEVREVEGFKLSDVKLEGKDGNTMFKALVTNTTSEKKAGFLAKVIVYDKTGNEIGTIPASITGTADDGTVEPGETIQMMCEIDLDYVNAYDYKLVK